MSNENGNHGNQTPQPPRPPARAPYGLTVTYDPNKDEVGLQLPPNRLQTWELIGILIEHQIQTGLQQSSPPEGGRILLPWRRG